MTHTLTSSAPHINHHLLRNLLWFTVPARNERAPHRSHRPLPPSSTALPSTLFAHEHELSTPLPYPVCQAGLSSHYVAGLVSQLPNPPGNAFSKFLDSRIPYSGDPYSSVLSWYSLALNLSQPHLNFYMPQCQQLRKLNTSTPRCPSKSLSSSDIGARPQKPTHNHHSPFLCLLPGSLPTATGETALASQSSERTLLSPLALHLIC